MEQGLLEFAPEVKPLEAISPTRFNGLMECALREVWAAGGAPSLLPSSPAAHLGSAIHRLLQEAGEGHFVPGGKATIERRWQQLVGAIEQEMRGSWLERHLIPLERSIHDFEVRRIQACDRALEITEASSHTPGALRQAGSGADYGLELYLSSPDGLIRGHIDAVLPSAEGPVIRDYKSGAIFEDHPGNSSILRASYETQLRMYAALYASRRGRWPVRLEVVALSGAPQSVNFDEAACMRLLEEARQVLSRVNRTITQIGHFPNELQSRLANPSPANCARCLYRPGCFPYQSAVAPDRSRGDWPNDLWGRVADMHKLGNSKTMITLSTRDGTARIRGLTSGGVRHPALASLHPGEDMAAFNLGVAGSGQTFLETQFTTIYRVASGASS